MYLHDTLLSDIPDSQFSSTLFVRSGHILAIVAPREGVDLVRKPTEVEQFRGRFRVPDFDDLVEPRGS